MPLFLRNRPWIWIVAGFLVLIASWVWLIGVAVERGPEKITVDTPASHESS